MKSILATILIVLTINFAHAQNQYRQRNLFDFDWKFAFGHPSDVSKDFYTGTSYFSYLAKAGYGDGAASLNFDDRAWRKLDLPHDWVVETPFDAKGSHSHGYKAVGRNFPEASVGWYRKHFTISNEDFGKQIFIDFDGVMRDAQVWVNGHYLGNEPSGYQSFSFNITDILNYGGNNVIAVRADVSMEEGWFYEGAGIYRHVWLRKTNPIHIPKDGTFIYTEPEEKGAKITIETEVVNRGLKTSNFSLRHKITDSSGVVVKASTIIGSRLLPTESGKAKLELILQDPRLWSVDDPYLYTMVTEVLVGGRVVDKYETPFGIRTIYFDADKGFFLNGKHIKLKGTNNHQNHAGVGAAIPDELNEFRIKTLKSMGCNAFRASHYPPTPELLAICDRLGVLVIDENRLMGTTENALNEFGRLIKRDRNHPSIIVWSAGNEEWKIEGNIIGERMARTMQNYAKRVDPTRPVTIAISGGRNGGILKSIEIMGSNYLVHGDTDEHHAKYPNQPFIGTEEGSTFATRGIYFKDDEKQYLPAYDQKPREKWPTIEQCWQHYAKRDYLAGMFIWTGFDYRGEPTPHSWPSVLSYFGMMDLCGFPKDNVYYLKSWWQDEPVLHILPHWNWKEGQEIDVWVYSNCDEVELFLNEKSLGKKKMEKNSHLEWKVAYKKGVVKAVGYKQGQKIIESERKTSGSPATIDLKASKAELVADNQDVSVVTVQVLDANGVPVPTSNNNIEFSLAGPGKIIGVGNGDQTSHEKEKFVDNHEVIELEELGLNDLSKESLKKYLPNVDTKKLDKFLQNPEFKILSGEFTLDAIAENSLAKLYFKKVGSSQSIYINGNLISEKVSDEKDKGKFSVKTKFLKVGKNEITVIAKPLKKKYEWDVPNKFPGSLQIITPAEKWQRKLFNGLAQVIIQSTKKAGKVTLKATSSGLVANELNIIVK
jgi:beta-galactosidase